MKTLQWTQFAPVGEDQVEVSGTLVDFFLSGACSTVVYFRVVPPLAVLNHLLKSGSSEKGMGGAWEWEPFALTETEYNELASGLVAAVPPHGLRAIQHLGGVPEWVSDESDLLAWLFYVPEQLHLALSSERKVVQAEILQEENEQRRAELREKLLQLEIQASNLWKENGDRRKCRVPPARLE
jgi:hypothetical protein